MKILLIARKLLLELWREPMLWVLLFVFPIGFVWLYDLAFGQTEGGMGRYFKVLVINEELPLPGFEGSLGAKLIDSLAASELEGQPLFEILRLGDRHQAEIILRERKAAALLFIPAGFTQAVMQARREGSSPTVSPPFEVWLVGDPGTDNFVFVQGYLEGLLQEFIQAEAGWQPTLTIGYEFIPGTGTTSDFDYGVPGLIVFGLMLLSASTALILVREETGGTLKRLRLAPISSGELLGGVLMSQMVLALAIVPATFAAAIALGFQSRGSWLTAVGIGLLVSLSAVGIGLLTACFTHSESAAANLSASLGVMLVLLCDALYPVPEMPIATLFGRTIQVYDLLPTAHAAEALRKVLLLGESAGGIAFETGALAVLSMAIFLAGTGLYWKMKG
jgi:ABC-2 type transport system permease protein